MKKLLLLLLTLLACACGASQCTPDPTSPSPAVVGGSTSTGGAFATGGVSTGGQSATGGTTATTVAVRFPACNSASAKAGPVDISRFRLGRKTEPMKRAKKASYEVADGLPPVFWPSRVPWALCQRSSSSMSWCDLGGCTGFTAIQARINSPFVLESIPGSPTTKEAFEELGRQIYHLATMRDAWEGVWPPEDTGSSGKAAIEAAISLNLFKSYKWLDSLADVQRALRISPVMFGSDWYEGMFYPSRCGEIKASGKVKGGHEYLLVGDDPDDKTLWGLTSWDNDFGVCLDEHCGYFKMSYGMFSDLLAQSGEAQLPE